jgi:hypothetical protein
MGGGCCSFIIDSRKYSGDTMSTPQMPAVTKTVLEKRV